MRDLYEELGYINTNISTVHADHVGVQTFVHEVKFVIEDSEAGIDQSCQAIIALSDECRKESTTSNVEKKALRVNM